MSHLKMNTLTNCPAKQGTFSGNLFSLSEHKNNSAQVLSNSQFLFQAICYVN